MRARGKRKNPPSSLLPSFCLRFFTPFSPLGPKRGIKDYANEPADPFFAICLAGKKHLPRRELRRGDFIHEDLFAFVAVPRGSCRNGPTRGSWLPSQTFVMPDEVRRSHSLPVGKTCLARRDSYARITYAAVHRAVYVDTYIYIYICIYIYMCMYICMYV